MQSQMSPVLQQLLERAAPPRVEPEQLFRLPILRSNAVGYLMTRVDRFTVSVKLTGRHVPLELDRIIVSANRRNNEVVWVGHFRSGETQRFAPPKALTEALGRLVAKDAELLEGELRPNDGPRFGRRGL